MSLEQTIADLVAASNNLTGSVNSKMNEIDQKVDQAVGSVPDTVKGIMSLEFFVDPVNGDDSSANGPLKTIPEAIKRGVSGSSITITLKPAERYFIEESVNIRSSYITIESSYAPGERPIVEFSTINDTGNEDFDGQPHNFRLIASHITFSGVEVVHPSATTGVIPKDTGSLRNSLFRSNGSTIAFDYKGDRDSAITLGDAKQACLVASDRSITTVVLAKCEATGLDGVIVKNRYGGATMVRIGSFTKDATLKLIESDSSFVDTSFIMPENWTHPA
ncbi:MAG: hypothetical protein ACQEXI_00325 [Pseudomonadota bacterium]